MELSKLEMLGSLILEAKRMEKESLIEFDTHNRLRDEAASAEQRAYRLRSEGEKIVAKAYELADQILDEKG